MNPISHYIGEHEWQSLKKEGALYEWCDKRNYVMFSIKGFCTSFPFAEITEHPRGYVILTKNVIIVAPNIFKKEDREDWYAVEDKETLDAYWDFERKLWNNCE